MNILAFDTSTSACSVALYYDHPGKGGQTLANHKIAPKQHTSIMLPMMQELLNSASLQLSQLNAIAFGCGPGSFTGIRIAASLAQGIAYANDLPVIPISSLAAASQAAYAQHQWEKLLVAVDARMEKIYWGAYQVENGLVSSVFDERLISPHQVTEIPDGQWYGIGDGWVDYQAQLESRIGLKPVKIDQEAVPTAEAVLSLAKVKFEKGDWVGASEALPVYLR